MFKLLQIADSLNWGSVGRIASQIGDLVMSKGGESYIAYGRYSNPSKSTPIKVGKSIELYWHILQTRLFDRHGLESRFATKQLISEIKKINPDIIHLHQIHGYFLNYPLLFDFLSSLDIPIVWTLHDCWLFTGHCAHFDLQGCTLWKTGCHNCPLKGEYPKSFFFDRSKKNYKQKKISFTSLGERLVLVPVSEWLANFVHDSFLKNTKTLTIHNGVDIDVFKPLSHVKVNDKIMPFRIMGCASPWTEKKGFNDFLRLRSILPIDKYHIIMVGLSHEQCLQLPEGITGVERTQNVQQLAELYSSSDVFVNTTYEDNYPTVNLEAISCGTPVITYDTGGSPESVSHLVGCVVEQGNIEQLVDAIRTIERYDKQLMSQQCRLYAEEHFSNKDCFQKYLNLYNELLNLR